MNRYLAILGLLAFLVAAGCEREPTEPARDTRPMEEPARDTRPMEEPARPDAPPQQQPGQPGQPGTQ